jgi:hypothetical protein
MGIVQPPRLPSSEQWVRWAAARPEIGMDEVAFAGRCDLYGLEAGLTSARSIVDADPREQTARALATLLRWQAKKPPFEPRRRHLAIETAELCAGLCGYKLVLRNPQRAELARRAEGPQGAPRQLAGWLKPRLKQLHPELASRVRAGLEAELGPVGEGRPKLVISQPATFLDADDLEMLDSMVGRIRPACERAVRDMLLATGAEQEVDSLMGPIGVEAPTCDHRWENDARRNCQINRPLFLRANALVILGYRGGSHTTGFEHALIPAGAPVLYIGWQEDEVLPCAISGKLGPTEVEWAWVRDVEEVPTVVANFVCRRWSQIVDSWHTTNLRKLAYGPIAEEVGRRLEEIDGAQLERLARRWGFTADAPSMLTSVDGLAALGDETIRKLTSSLGLKVSPPAFSAGEIRLSDEQLHWLSHFQHECEVPPSEISRLRQAAEYELQVGTMRYSLHSVREWSEFRQSQREGE